MQPDKYYRDVRTWREFAEINHTAATKLFADLSPFMYFPAAILGHHALEMYLKAALVKLGMAVFNPQLIIKLDPGVTLTVAECVWGHKLVDLAERIATRSPLFDLNITIDIPSLILEMPMNIRTALEHFEPFFEELRYPRELDKLQGVGEEEGRLLNALVAYIGPFST